MRKIPRPTRRIARARSSDPQTSHEAAKSVNVTKSQAIVYRALRQHGPMTDEELISVIHVPMSDSGIRTRRRELVDRGLVDDTGKRATTRAGRRTIVWAAVPETSNNRPSDAL